MSGKGTGSTVSYAYDPQNLRKAKTVSGTTTNYVNIPKSLASASAQFIDPTTFGFNAGNQEIAEYDGSGNLLRRYVYGLGLDEPLVTIDAAGNHSYHFTDGLGSVVALANASGQLSEKHAYSACGLASSTAGTAFQFAGRRMSPDAGSTRRRGYTIIARVTTRRPLAVSCRRIRSAPMVVSISMLTLEMMHSMVRTPLACIRSNSVSPGA
jgi:hypothetical protein